ncbi:MAG: glycosyltransferase [Bacteroidota bacterium]
MSQRKNSVTIAYLGNANHDTRVTNLTKSLTQDNIDVKVISFDWTTPNFQTKIGETSIFKLDKSRSSIKYYLKFLQILIKELLKTNSSIYIAEDIYSLPVVAFIAKLKKAKLYYNSREFYAFLGGLRNRKQLQAAIRVIEKFFIKKTDKVFVTGEGDAEFLEEYYGIPNTVVIRNLPLEQKPTKEINLREKLGIPENDLILLYQGVILEGRGFQPILETLAKIDNFHLVVLGSGPFQNNYEKLAQKLTITNRVHFLGTIDQAELINYTSAADIGLALIENISKSYYYALPNKLFEYIMAEIPVLCSNLPQMKKIVEDYQVGEVIDIEEVGELTERLRTLILNRDLLFDYKQNCKHASSVLNWQNEYEKVKHLFVG